MLRSLKVSSASREQASETARGAEPKKKGDCVMRHMTRLLPVTARKG